MWRKVFFRAITDQQSTFNVLIMVDNILFDKNGFWLNLTIFFVLTVVRYLNFNGFLEIRILVAFENLNFNDF